MRLFKRDPIYICPHCLESFDRPKKRNKGSLLVLVGLLLLLIVPGVIYGLWMLGANEKICPSCKATGFIKTKTPKGQSLLKSVAA